MSDAPIQTGKAARISLWFAVGTPAFVLLTFLISMAVNGFDLVGIALLVAPVLHVTGAVFGIVAMVKRDRPKLGALGVGLNVGLIALGAGLLAWLIYVAAGAIHMG
jgi:hypothetical protein